MSDSEETQTYSMIDIDPHFTRVVSNFRPTDYAAWAAGTTAFPGALYLWQMIDPSKLPKAGLGPALRLSTFLGACGGFLVAYQRSSFRFWGTRENNIEQARAEREGQSAPGLDVSKSSLDPYMQGVAHRNSVFSQLKFSVLPWFNLVNHPHHSGPGQQTSEPSE